VNNETIVKSSNESELIHRIRYHKEQPKEAQGIIQAAQVAAQEHSWDARGKLMVAATRDHSKCNKLAYT
jgi:hypothetical protein